MEKTGLLRKNNLPKRISLLGKKCWGQPGIRAFSIGILVSFLFFLPYILLDKGYFLYYGDFNVQQVPFYQMLHDVIRSGDFLWSWTTDLGANTIGSYSFYNLTSPFFWLTLPFSSKAVPYFMGPLLILKFGCASLTGWVYLRRYVKNQDFAVLGGLLYAFSGYSVYNVFFNHFMEPVVFFPLLLAAIDSYMYERKRGVLALAVFACCWVNYYFFVGQVVFCLIYWILRLATDSWRISVKDFLWMVWEAVVGVLLTCVMLLPTVLAVLQNDRVNNPGVGWSTLLYGNEQRYLHILQCLFFPPDIPARPNFTPDSNAKWASLGAWIPLFGMTGVIAWLQSKKKNWLKKIIIICFLMAAIPICNSAFQLFNSTYYARWYYMMVLMLAAATVCALESDNIEWERAFRWSIGITVAIAAGVGLMPSETIGNKISAIGLEEYPYRFWPYVALTLLGLLAAYLLLPILLKSKKRFASYAIITVSVMSCIYSLYLIGMGKTLSYDTKNFIIPYALNNGEELSLPDENENEFYRSDFYESMDNMGMYWKMPTIQAFHSIVPGSVMKFYNDIGVERNVASRPSAGHIGIRGLLSVKYLFDDPSDSDEFIDEETHEMKIPGFYYYDTQNGFDIYVNKAYIPMGFTYSEYCTTEQLSELSGNDKEMLMLRAICLNEQQIEKYSDILAPLETVSYYSDEGYLELCKERATETCDTFVISGRGFEASITLSADRLVFFSVPYENGWTAYVDGKPVDIEQVNIGFMAIKVAAGSHSISFRYTTPGLKIGVIISAGTLILFALSLFLLFLLQRRRNKAQTNL